LNTTQGVSSRSTNFYYSTELGDIQKVVIYIVLITPGLYEPKRGNGLYQYDIE
jgi:hypothetical protein